ncbi:hypothetical protein [Enterobacter bugandensis]
MAHPQVMGSCTLPDNAVASKWLIHTKDKVIDPKAALGINLKSGEK